MSETPAIIVFTTASSKDEAERLAKGAVGQKHAACVQIIRGVESVYEWKGEIKTDPEFLLLIKTTADKFRGLEDFLKTSHSYDVPEIISVPADRVSAEYLAWMRNNLV